MQSKGRREKTVTIHAIFIKQSFLSITAIAQSAERQSVNLKYGGTNTGVPFFFFQHTSMQYGRNIFASCRIQCSVHMSQIHNGASLL